MKSIPEYGTKQEAKQKRNLKKRDLIPQYGQAGLKKGRFKMGRRTASDRMAKCIIDMVHEYKKRVEKLEYQVLALKSDNEGLTERLKKAVDQANDATDTLGEIADIIAGITDHTESGNIRIYLSDVIPKDGIKIKRLFRFLDIPMTAEQIKEGDKIDED